MLSEHCTTPRAFNNSTSTASSSPAAAAIATSTASTLTNASGTSITTTTAAAATTTSVLKRRSSKDENFSLNSDYKPNFNSINNSSKHLATCSNISSSTTTLLKSNSRTTKPTTVSHFNRYPMTKQLSTTTAPAGVNGVATGSDSAAGQNPHSNGSSGSSSGNSTSGTSVVTNGNAVSANGLSNGSSSFAVHFLHNNNLTPTIISPTASLSPTNPATTQLSPTSGATTGTIPKKCLMSQQESAKEKTSTTAAVTVLATPPSPTASSTTTTTTITTNHQHSTTTTATPATLTSSQTSTSLTSPTTKPCQATAITGATSNSLAAAEAAKKAAAATATTTASASSSSNDANGRSAALERAYVHDVYEHCEEPTGSLRPRVAQFLSNLEPGSVVCDVGCGSGRYLTQCNPSICTVGVDRCHRLSRVAKEKGGEVALCDNLELPFRDESFDAVLSIAVVHHFATTERRVNALRELARILRIGGRVVITVWALEQRHRRFESQDVLIPWQPPKNRNFNYSDEEDDEDFLPPYHAYTEDSTNSSRSAGDGDSSSLSSSSPGESCYSFVRRAIQKLAGGRKHAWFLESWTSKDTKNDSSMDYEDAKDLPIELRRLEDFEDFTDPPLSAGLKSRSLGSILNPPPRQIVRSRSSVPSLGGPLVPGVVVENGSKNLQFLDAPHYGATPSAAGAGGASGSPNSSSHSNGHSPINHSSTSPNSNLLTSSNLSRRPKLIKQKQSLCDEDYQLPDTPFHMLSQYNVATNGVTSSLYASGKSMPNRADSSHLTTRQMRKQSSLNEELMAGNRIREKERVRKRIQKQMSLNEAFLCRSALFSKRLQVIREGFTSKIKSSTGSLERVTKTGITKIMQNLKTTGNEEKSPAGNVACPSTVKASKAAMCTHEHHHHHHHQQHYQQQQQQQQQNSPLVSNFQTHLHHLLHRQNTAPTTNKFAGPVTICKSLECAATACYCQTYHQGCSQCNAESGEEKARRHSRESGSDSSKDSSLQSDTSIESEDSFASVIFIPKPEQHQQQLNYQKQHQNSNSSSSNSSSSNGGGSGGCYVHKTCCQSRCVSSSTLGGGAQCCKLDINGHRISSVPTSPLIMPCPPTPAHSPAAAQTQVTSPPQTVPAVVAVMAMFTPPPPHSAVKTTIAEEVTNGAQEKPMVNGFNKTRFNFDEAHIRQQETKDMLQQQQQQQQQQNLKTEIRKTEPLRDPFEKDILPKKTLLEPKITRQTIQNLPPIPKFRKQQSLQISRQNYPIVRRTTTASGGAAIATIPKLMSLELFNPATDDLDSDSSEPSSPDSVDSVISAPRSNALTTAPSLDQAKDSSPLEEKEKSNETNAQADKKSPIPADSDIIVNEDAGDIVPTKYGGQQSNPPEDCAEFAEKLSAQLMRELEEKTQSRETKSRSLENVNEEFYDDPFAPLAPNRKRNGDKDLTALRDELRERRLMLANLSTQPSLNQSPNSSSTSSLSSQTRSFTIHEEDEEEDEEEHERSYSLQLYENCKISKLNYKRHLHNNNLHPETTYLLQDEDSSFKDEEEDNEVEEEIEHDVIPEEDEEDEDEPSQDNDRSSTKTKDTTLKCDSLEDREDETKKSSGEETTLQNRNQSTESWEHSNSSTTSLDSPSQGGATTHHRYYHVFREGELDALINHHVASLHIVSSYYERASWCVVAEKVQVWTI